MPEVPLTALLARTWIAHTIEIDNAVERAGADHVGRLFRISLPMWTNGLRFVAEAGITIGELRRQAAARCNIAGLERWGWIVVGDNTQGRRDGYGTQKGVNDDTVLRPTRAGIYARRVFACSINAVEARWRQRFGAEVVDTVYAELTPLTAEMPWSPPEVHASDGFFTHVMSGGSTAGERPLVAMLGQALTGLTVEQERDAPVSLPLAANLLRTIGEDAVPVKALPARTGLSKEAITMAVNYLQRRHLAAIGPDRAIRLTVAGSDALGAYRSRGRRRDAAALRAALTALLEQTEALKAGLVPPEGCWRNQAPYLAQTQRLVADPIDALPWHPMVLHRGGWPDGS